MDKKEKIKKALELYELVNLYYKDLDSLTSRLQDNYNNGTEFEQDEQDRLALGMILDFVDTMEDMQNISRQTTDKVDIKIQYLEEKEQIEIIRKATQEYGELEILSYIEPMKKDNFDLYCFYKNVLLFPELYLEYENIYPNNILY